MAYRMTTCLMALMGVACSATPMNEGADAAIGSAGPVTVDTTNHNPPGLPAPYDSATPMNEDADAAEGSACPVTVDTTNDNTPGFQASDPFIPTPGTVTGVQGDRLDMDVGGEMISFLWQGPSLVSSFSI